MKIAVVGASGFVGTRLIETIVLGNDSLEVVPVVRSHSSLALIARFDLRAKVCDIFDPSALAGAFADCDAVIHSALGDSQQIVRMAESVYKAADQAGVKRLVVLSSASVHGLNPVSTVEESTPLHDDHSFWYSNAKIRAERAILRLSKAGSTQPVFLRPSIVYGPRSSWVSDCAKDLITRRAYLINAGAGICNAIYVDNLVHAILLCLQTPDVAGEAFLVRDQQIVSWRDFYARIASGIGVTMDDVADITPPVFYRSRKEQVQNLVATPAIQAALPLIPARLKRIVKSTLSNWDPPVLPDRWADGGSRYLVTEEMALLQQCVWKMPVSKAESMLGYHAPVSLEDGIKRSIEWLKFAGFPISNPVCASSG